MQPHEASRKEGKRLLMVGNPPLLTVAFVSVFPLWLGTVPLGRRCLLVPSCFVSLPHSLHFLFFSSLTRRATAREGVVRSAGVVRGSVLWHGAGPAHKREEGIAALALAFTLGPCSESEPPVPHACLTRLVLGLCELSSAFPGPAVCSEHWPLSQPHPFPICTLCLRLTAPGLE